MKTTMTLTTALGRFTDLLPVPEAPCRECRSTPLGGWDPESGQCVSVCLRCGRLEWDHDIFHGPPAASLPRRVAITDQERISL